MATPLPSGERWKVSSDINEKWPEDWPIETLGEHISITNGDAFDSDKFVMEGGIPLVRIRDIHSVQTEKNYEGPYENEYLVERGDILVGMDGDFECARWRGGEALLNQRVCRIEVSSDDLDEEFLYQILQPYLDAIHAVTSSVTVKHLSSKTIQRLQIPVPATDTQKETARRLQIAKEHVNNTENHLARVPELVDKFEKSLLAEAFSGELSREWRAKHPDVEPARELLERIRPERKRKWVQNYAANLADRARKRNEKKGKTFTEQDWQDYYDKKIPQGEDRYEAPDPVDPDEEDLPEIPETWEWVRLEEIIAVGPQNGLYEPKSAYGSGTPIIRIDDYQTDWLRSEDDLKLVETSLGNREKYSLSEDEVVINRVNSPSHLGKSFAVPASHEGCLFESNMMRVTPVDGVLPEFVAEYCNSPIGNRRLTENAKWAVNQASINQSDVLNTPLPLPPEKEQRRIIHNLNSNWTKIHTISEQAEKAENHLSQLRSSMLADMLGTSDGAAAE